MAFLQGSATVVLGSMSSGGTATIAAGTFYHVTSATQTITLPASPNSGDIVGISVGNFSDTVVARNGTNICD